MNNKVWIELKKEIKRGKKGYNKGLPMGFKRLSKYVANIQQGRYDTIGGATGTGKTAFVDSAYVFHPYDHIIRNPNCFYDIEIIYYSLEIPPVVKLAKMVCLKIWEDYGLLSNVNEIFSKGEFHIPEEIYKLIPLYEEYFAELQENVLFFRNSLSPDYLYKDIMSYAESRGEVIKGKNNVIKKYIPKNPNLITLIIIDHISLIDKNKQDKSKKEAIDRASKFLVFFRNNFKFSPVVVSQFNRNIEGMDRKQNSAVEPQLSDFKDTGATQEDANTVMALFNPFRYNMDFHRKYPIMGSQGLQRDYRGLSILKNRDGTDNMALGLHFIGEVGKFRELPKASDIEKNPQLLKKILNTRNIHKKKFL